MKLGSVTLTPSVLGMSFGVLLLVMSGLAGFYVPGGPSYSVESAPTVSTPTALVSAPTIAASATATAATRATSAPAQEPAPSATATVASVETPTSMPTTPTPQVSPTPLSSPTNTATPAPYVTYTIKQGDTLSDVADRYGVSVDSIIRYNGLGSADDLQIGDKITIPTGAPPPAPASAPPSQPVTVYSIKEGDTISGIADRYGVSVDSIIRYNGLSSPDDLKVGDKISIP